MSMMFAPAAMGQTVFPESDGSGATIGDGCPAGQFGAIPAGTIGETGFSCFGTQEKAQYYAETGQTLPEEQAPAQNPQAPSQNAACTSVQERLNAGDDSLTPAELLSCSLSPEAIGVGPSIGGPNGVGEVNECSDLPPGSQQSISCYEDLIVGLPTGPEPPFPGAEEAASTDQYTDDDMAALPDTSGPSLGGIAVGSGILLMAGSLLLRRRLS